MHIKNPHCLVVFFFAVFMASARAQVAADPPNEKDAIAIIATHEQIKASLYKIIRVTPGKQLEKNGFLQDNIVRVTTFAPASSGRPARVIKHYLMQYTEEYGWFLESTKNDARGVYLEISSQNMGRVFVR